MQVFAKQRQRRHFFRTQRRRAKYRVTSLSRKLCADLLFNFQRSKIDIFIISLLFSFPLSHAAPKVGSLSHDRPSSLLSSAPTTTAHTSPSQATNEDYYHHGTLEACLDRHVYRYYPAMQRLPECTNNLMKHWSLNMQVDRSLFSTETRPLSIRNTYARAHAPGDVRLVSNRGDGGSNYPSMVKRKESQQTETDGAQSTIGTTVNGESQVGSCHCHCGQCHVEVPVEDASKAAAEVDKSELDCNCHRASTGSSGSSSTPSSVVTWSSITSSMFDNHHHLTASHSHPVDGTKSKTPGVVKHLDSCKHAQRIDQEDKSPTSKSQNQERTKTIDNFFRKNVSVVDEYDQRPTTNGSTCSCSCPGGPRSRAAATDFTDSSVANSKPTSALMTTSLISTTSQDSQVPRREDSVIGDPNKHGYDNWAWYWNDTIDEEAKRWSAAAAAQSSTSPLKPARLHDDDTLIWLRENIETRRVCLF